jgi:hypothetical protein
VSVEALAVVLHHSRARGTAKLVLIGIANHEGDGGSWPAVGTLATYANVSRVNVQRSLTALEKLGEVHRATQDGGTRSTPDWDRPNLYRVLVKCPPNCDHTTAHRMLCIGCGKTLDRARRTMLTHAKCDPAAPAIPRRASAAPPAAPAIPEPSFNPTTNNGVEKNDQVLNRASDALAYGSQSKIDAYGDDLTTADATLTGAQTAESCPRRVSGAPHAYAAVSGRCIDCYAVDPDHINRSDGAA